MPRSPSATVSVVAASAMSRDGLLDIETCPPKSRVNPRFLMVPRWQRAITLPAGSPRRPEHGWPAGPQHSRDGPAQANRAQRRLRAPRDGAPRPTGSFSRSVPREPAPLHAQHAILARRPVRPQHHPGRLARCFIRSSKRPDSRARIIASRSPFCSPWPDDRVLRVGPRHAVAHCAPPRGRRAR